MFGINPQLSQIPRTANLHDDAWKSRRVGVRLNPCICLLPVRSKAIGWKTNKMRGKITFMIYLTYLAGA